MSNKTRARVFEVCMDCWVVCW